MKTQQANPTRLLLIVTVTGILLGSLTSYALFSLTQTRSGYIENHRVFDGFAGKKYLEGKLKAIKAKNQARLDSLQKTMPASWLQAEMERVALEEHELAARYDADIWKEINRLVSVFGEERGYDYVFGASGSGSLMYSAKGNDITEEVVTFINARYSRSDTD